MWEDNAFKVFIGSIFLIAGFGFGLWGLFSEVVGRSILGLALTAVGMLCLFWGILSEIF